MHAAYIKIFLKKKKTKGVNMNVNNIEIFLRKRKTKSINMYANDIEIIVKRSEIKKRYLLWKYDKLDFFWQLQKIIFI